MPESIIFSKTLLSCMRKRWARIIGKVIPWNNDIPCDEILLGMQISNFRYANMDFFFQIPHIQIRFLRKDPVFKYEFLVLVSLKMLQIFCHNLEPGFGVLKIPVSLSLERAHNSAF